jgi:beta-glucanase (GH16 family)
MALCDIGVGASSFQAESCNLWSTVLTIALVCTIFVPAKASLAWIDPDTPAAARATDALSPGDSRPYQLVFSDEFQIPGRTFHDGHDPRWTALEKNDLTNNPLHYYSQDAITTTSNGTLSLGIDYTPKQFTKYNNETETKNFRTGMLQSWNKFCFMGGILEISAKLPGSAHVGGLWPAGK